MRESVPSGVLTSAIRPAFVASAIVWALVLPLAPFIAAQPHPAPAVVAFLYAVYLTGSAICHQLPERSFDLWGHQMPVCARCSGIYSGAAIVAVVAIGTAALRTIARRAPARPHHRSAALWRAILGASAMPAAISLLYEWTTGHMPSNWVRAATGVPLGAVVAWMVLWATRPGRAERIR